MQLFNLEISKYGIDLQTYFGDIYLYHRAWMLILGVVVVLRLAKIIRKRNNQKAALAFEPVSDTDLWSN
jgi:hypothetical protein